MGEVASVLVGQTVKSIKISEIKIVNRQRSLVPDTKEFKEWMEHVQRLASSIKRAGLLHPVTLEDGTNQLLAGFNRVQAFMLLGRDEIPFVYRSELSDIDKQVIELEENVARLDISFADKVKAIAQIDELQRRLAGDRGEAWTTAKTAEMVGVSVGTVSQAKKVVEAAKLDPSLLESSGLVAALNKVKAGEALQKRKDDIAKREAGVIRTYPAEIIVGDALDLIRQEPDESFDAVITNFPFGVELKLGEDRKEVYHDAEDYIVGLVRRVTHECYRVLRPDSWMVAWFDIRKITYSNKMRLFADRVMPYIAKMQAAGLMKKEEYEWLHELADDALGLTYWMEEAGFDYVQLLPAIWYKPNKTQGNVGDPNKGMVMAYEAFVLAGKGNPQLLRKGRQNIFGYDTVLGADRDIDVQMPTSICMEVVSMVCLGGSRVLDPFAGSGAIGEGALSNQCSFRGYELDPKRAEIGNLRLREHIHAQGGKTDSAEGKDFQAKMHAYLAQQRELEQAGLNGG